MDIEDGKAGQSPSELIILQIIGKFFLFKLNSSLQNEHYLGVSVHLTAILLLYYILLSDFKTFEVSGYLLSPMPIKVLKKS